MSYLRFSDPSSSVTINTGRHHAGFAAAAANEIGVALCLRAGINAALLNQKILDNADFRFGGGLDVRGAIRAAAELDGISIGGLDMRGQLQATSGGTLGAIFTGVAETVLATSFAEAEDTTAGWVSERAVENFKTQKRPHMEPQEAMTKLPRGKAPEHIAINTTAAESYSVTRFASKFEVDEQDLVDDDIDALAQPTQVIGRASMKKKLDLLYTILLANANLADGVALFDAAGHGNLDTGSALAAATLQSATAAMRLQTENGELLGVVPRYLILPPELEQTARQLLVNIRLDDGTDLTPRIEPRLSAGVTDPDGGTSYAGSATTWFMAASARQAPVLELGYIGSPTPAVSTYDLGPGRWGKGYRVALDIGCKALAFQGLHKSTA